MLDQVSRHLRCPTCGEAFTRTGGSLTCARGHTFDVARQGYVNMLRGRAPEGAETVEMVRARAEFLGRGHFAFLATAVAREAARAAGGARRPRLVVDVGAGTGHYLAAVLDELPDHYGLALDIAKPAVRRAAKAHPRASAAVCDVWRGLPLAQGCADLVLNIFAPRNGPEFRRVLCDTGALIVVTPERDHLGELVAGLELVRVDPDKQARLRARLDPWFTSRQERVYRRELSLRHDEAALLVAMGPSAWHVDPNEVQARLSRLPEPLTVTASVRLHVLSPLPGAPTA